MKRDERPGVDTEQVLVPPKGAHGTAETNRWSGQFERLAGEAPPKLSAALRDAATRVVDEKSLRAELAALEYDEASIVRAIRRARGGLRRARFLRTAGLASVAILLAGALHLVEADVAPDPRFRLSAKDAFEGRFDRYVRGAVGVRGVHRLTATTVWKETAGFADSHGWCYPSKRAVAKRANCCPRTVQRVWEVLEQLGHMMIFPQNERRPPDLCDADLVPGTQRPRRSHMILMLPIAVDAEDGPPGPTAVSEPPEAPEPSAQRPAPPPPPPALLSERSAPPPAPPQPRPAPPQPSRAAVEDAEHEVTRHQRPTAAPAREPPPSLVTAILQDLRGYSRLAEIAVVGHARTLAAVATEIHLEDAQWREGLRQHAAAVVVGRAAATVEMASIFITNCSRLQKRVESERGRRESERARQRREVTEAGAEAVRVDGPACDDDQAAAVSTGIARRLASEETARARVEAEEARLKALRTMASPVAASLPLPAGRSRLLGEIVRAVHPPAASSADGLEQEVVPPPPEFAALSPRAATCALELDLDLELKSGADPPPK